MEIKATILFRNNKMINARKKRGLTQADCAGLSGVAIQTISMLENLHYPRLLSVDTVWGIAETLGLAEEDVYPEKLRGQILLERMEVVREIEAGRLIEYQQRQQGRFLLPSPEDVAEKEDWREVVKKRFEKVFWILSDRETKIIKLRFGFEGSERTLLEVGKRFHISAARVRSIEAMALRKLKRQLELV